MEESKSPKLYLSMILAEYEPEDIVQRSINSVSEYVDGIYVTVTYKDKTPKKTSKLVKALNKLGANVSYFKWTKDFAEARQFAMDQVPHGPHNYIYWQDADDVLRNAQNLKVVVNEMEKLNVAAWFFPYWYQVDLDEKGEVREIVVEHKRERIIRNDNTFKWIGSLHETLIEQKQENIQKYSSEDCTVVHLSNEDRTSKNIDRNIEILEETIRKEKRQDPRTIVHLGKAYFDKAKIFAKSPAEFKMFSDLSLTLFNEYLNGFGTPGEVSYQEASGWKEERSTIWSYIAELAILSQQPEVALQAYQSAIDECPFFPNYYIDKAMVHTMLGEYKEAKHFLKIATSMEMPKTTIIVTPREIKSRALEVALQIALNENKLDDAQAYIEELQQIYPNEKAIEERLLTVKSINSFNKACQSAVFLGKYLEQIGEKDKLPHLVQALSNDMQHEKFASEMRHKFMPKKLWGEKEVAILCGPGFEEWSPKSLKKGLGGSEEAVVHMGNELTKIGWKVTVYANPGKEAGNHDGVEYRPYYELNPKDAFNVLILWRSIGFVDFNPNTRFTMVWMHDVPNNPDFTEARVNKVDKIAVLSEFHESLLRMEKDGEFVPMPKGKVFLTSNGIAEMTNEWSGDPKKMIYASSPDRGLVYLLKNWEAIRKEVPDATLDVYYGFEVFDVIHRNNPARMQWKNQVMEMMKQPGITYHGRIGHEELHQKYSEAGVWAYPTDFEEISCISAMKAQALGAIPVVTNYAALQETVKNGVKVDVDITDDEGQKEYVEALVNVLNKPEDQEEMRKNMVEFAKNYFSWSNVAKNWDSEFNSWIDHPERRFILEED